MKIHYYLGWFNNGFPEKLKKLLFTDITDRKSLVMISAYPSSDENKEIGVNECSWFQEANILFSEYHLIDYAVQKEKARKLMEGASVILLLGGDAKEQNDLLVNYELLDCIKEFKGIVIGVSAGAINMSTKWLHSSYTGCVGNECFLYKGIGLDGISILSHFDLENNLAHIQDDLAILLEDINVYASNKDCAIRVEENQIDILGQVYLISTSMIKKIEETL